MKRLPLTLEQIEAVISEHPTPFHLYDRQEITERVLAVQSAFSWNEGYREHFAVKALPNPAILSLLRDLGCGVDCASMTELMLAERVGFSGEEIMFTSNNTPGEDYEYARQLNATINLDDVSHIPFLQEHGGIPSRICIRYTPDSLGAETNEIIGKTGESKYGVTREQLFEAFAVLKDLGVTEFGIHSMMASNSRDEGYYPALAEELFSTAVEIKEKLGIEVAFLNLAGGLGIPYHPDEEPLDLEVSAAGVREVYQRVLTPAGLSPTLSSELGRYITGPAGYLVTRVLHRKKSYRGYVGVDASAVDLLRPAMYGAYHHVTVVGKEDIEATETYDVVGSLCENNDKFAINRSLPEINVGDVVVVHDTGAHGHSMGYNYNGRLRSAELLLHPDGSVEQIRRAETAADYFATLEF